MSLKERNNIVPQMRDYDLVGDNWLPYLMRFDSPSKTFRSVSTDQWGFRTTTDRGGEPIDIHTRRRGNVPANIVLGSSAVFGVGATKDSRTIASYLNKSDDREWWNYGGRALNSTQELILLQLFMPEQVDSIIVCSGVNNLTLAGISNKSSEIFNSFYYQTLFERAMQNPPQKEIGLSQALKLLLHAFSNKISGPDHKKPEEAIENRYDAALACTRRDLRCLSALASGLDAKLYFALQPFATWLDKPLADEEDKLFAILNNVSREWDVLANHLGVFQHRYTEDLSNICQSLSIPFCDLNKSELFQTKDWLFVDRIHLTDAGYSLVADELKRQFQL